MNKLVIIIFLVLSLFIFINPLKGDDAFFYANGICEGNIVSADVGFENLLSFFPCNELVFKFYLILCLGAVMGLVYLIGRIYDKKNAWLLVGLVFCCSFFGAEFLKFENDLIGYVFIFLGVFLWLYGLERKKKEFFVYAIVTLIFAGLFWKGAVYFLFLLSFTTLFTLPIALFLVLFFWGKFFWFIWATQEVQEHLIGLSLVYWFFLTFLFWFGLTKIPKYLIIPTILSFIIGLFVGKLFVVGVLFLGLATWFHVKDNEFLFNIFKIGCILMLVFWFFNFAQQFPVESDYELVRNNLEVNDNSFGVGYLIDYLGGKPVKWGSPSGDLDFNGRLIVHRP
jgi:hypothetical protein